MIEEIERSNLLIVPLDDERHWFRYHGLFADVLQAHLKAKQAGTKCHDPAWACQVNGMAQTG
ncbi:MAG: hypothetical protein IPK19_10725 [Chloroflexi bacterium]|nr:hypothetical protein [Chloroflexota bacterium]